jgi:drug/metabolite transporter (DMT)-like permease
MAAAGGAFLMLSIMALFAKLLSTTLHVTEIAFWRNVIALIPFLLIISFFGRRDILKVNSKPRTLAARAIIGTLNILFVFGSFSLLPMANATSLIFAASLFMPMLGFFFLGERVGAYRWSAVLVGFAGVLLVAQPGASWNSLGIMLGIGAAFMNSVLGTLLRVLGRTEKPETTTFYFLLIGMCLLAPVMPFVWVTPSSDQIGFLIGLGLSGSMMQFLMSAAFKYAPAALAAIFNYTQIIWATFFGWAVFGDWPTANILVGAAIIIGSSAIVILRESYLARKGRLKAGGPSALSDEAD